MFRFKEHVQSNNPKHFLSEEEFVQLRVELANANKPNGDDAPGEELPPGTEDLPDPAKVRVPSAVCGVIKHGRGRQGRLADPGDKQNVCRFEEVSFR